jgi:hypothetical protein
MNSVELTCLKSKFVGPNRKTNRTSQMPSSKLYSQYGVYILAERLIPFVPADLHVEATELMIGA